MAGTAIVRPERPWVQVDSFIIIFAPPVRALFRMFALIVALHLECPWRVEPIWTMECGDRSPHSIIQKPPRNTCFRCRVEL